NGIATFNVGGGIVIDSDPASEYDESMLKAKALLRVLGAQPDGVDLAATASGPSPAISG
ncbi:MAG: chorismate-binding protein, partial [Acidobacteria bacterium]|nr:chorismate-binding protein [Acidobacteriota bacterium]